MTAAALNEKFSVEGINELKGSWDRSWAKMCQRIPDIDEVLVDLLDSEVVEVMLADNTNEDYTAEEMIDDMRTCLMMGEFAFGADYVLAQMSVRPETFICALMYSTGEIERLLLEDEPLLAYTAAYLSAYGMCIHASTDVEENYDRVVMTYQTLALLKEMELPEPMRRRIEILLHQAFSEAEAETQDLPRLPKNKLN